MSLAKIAAEASRNLTIMPHLSAKILSVMLWHIERKLFWFRTPTMKPQEYKNAQGTIIWYIWPLKTSGTKTLIPLAVKEESRGYFQVQKNDIFILLMLVPFLPPPPPPPMRGLDKHSKNWKTRLWSLCAFLQTRGQNLIIIRCLRQMAAKMVKKSAQEAWTSWLVGYTHKPGLHLL